MQCHVCEGTQFEEENGFFTCMICNTRHLGAISTVQEEEEMPGGPEGGQPMIRRKLGGPTRVRSWMTYEEGLQHILRMQVEVLIADFGFPEVYKEVVHKLWEHYLSTSSITMQRKSGHLRSKNSAKFTAIHKSPEDYDDDSEFTTDSESDSENDLKKKKNGLGDDSDYSDDQNEQEQSDYEELDRMGADDTSSEESDEDEGPPKKKHDTGESNKNNEDFHIIGSSLMIDTPLQALANAALGPTAPKASEKKKSKKKSEIFKTAEINPSKLPEMTPEEQLLGTFLVPMPGDHAHIPPERVRAVDRRGLIPESYLPELTKPTGYISTEIVATKMRAFRFTDIFRGSSTVRITLCILYIACLYLRMPVLPTDISKWARAGRIPYFSAHTALPRDMVDRKLLRPRYTPGSTRLFDMSVRLVRQMRMRRKCPPINDAAVLHRLTKLLDLPPAITQASLRLLSMNRSYYGVIDQLNSPYCLLLAHIVVVLKLLYRFDDSPVQSIQATKNPALGPKTLAEFVKMQQARLLNRKIDIPWTLDELRKLPSEGLNAFIDYCRDHVFGSYASQSFMDSLKMFDKGPVEADLTGIDPFKPAGIESTELDDPAAATALRPPPIHIFTSEGQRYVVYKDTPLGDYHKSYSMLLEFVSDAIEVKPAKLHDAVVRVETVLFPTLSSHYRAEDSAVTMYYKYK